MRAALFDLDETILDRTRSLKDFATWQAAGMLRSTVKDAEWFVSRFLDLDQNGMVWKDKVYRTLVREFQIFDWSVDELVQSYVLTFCGFCKLKEGAVDAIEKFKLAGYKIGLVTNGKTPFQERNFRALGISNLFDCVVVSEAVGMRKPEKQIFELACSTLESNVSSSVFIGDNPIADIKGAKEAGMQTIYLPRKKGSENCEYADVTYDSLLDIELKDLDACLRM